MILKSITVNIEDFPTPLRSYLSGAMLYDSSCSPNAKVIFIEKGKGFFLKISAPGTLRLECDMTRFFHGVGMAARVIEFFSDADREYLLTEKLHGDDGTAAKYLAQPERLCDTLAQRLALLHAQAYVGCPVRNHTQRYLFAAERNYHAQHFDASLFPDNWGYSTAEEAYAVVKTKGHLLQTDTLLHGDYCLPNIILDDWKFVGFVDLDSGGVGDRHIDIFWAVWTLNYNLKTDKYRQRFYDAYGRDKIDEEILRLVAACEVFG